MKIILILFLLPLFIYAADTGEILFQLKSDMHISKLTKNAKLVSPLFKVYKKPAKDTYKETIVLLQNKDVLAAEPNYIYYADEMPNDPKFLSQWALRKIKMPDTWNIVLSSNKIVAVIDSGVNYLHEDLKDNIWQSPTGEYGYDFVNNHPNAMDDFGHGTHVAGIIGALGNNAKGISGINMKIKVMPIKFLGADGSGTVENAIKAIEYAYKNGATVLNNSWGGGDFSQILFNVIQESKNKGLLFVASAGNDGKDNDLITRYPSGFDLDNIIAVAASNMEDGMPYFSNWGFNKVNLAAPGYSILSTYKDDYKEFSGTSMACPHVSGVAALLWGKESNLTYMDVKNRLMNTVDIIPTFKYKVKSRGRLNAYRAILNLNNTPIIEPTTYLTQNVKLETKHPYDIQPYKFVIQPTLKTTWIKIKFDYVDIFKGELQDFLFVKDADGNIIDRINGNMTDYITPAYNTSKLTLEFNPKYYATKKNGFLITKILYQ